MPLRQHRRGRFFLLFGFGASGNPQKRCTTLALTKSNIFHAFYEVSMCNVEQQYPTNTHTEPQSPQKPTHKPPCWCQGLDSAQTNQGRHCWEAAFTQLDNSPHITTAALIPVFNTRSSSPGQEWFWFLFSLHTSSS